MRGLDANALLRIAFPEQVERIAALRVQDSEFDELCADFTAIAMLVAQQNQTPAAEDLRESLLGLKQDIQAAVTETYRDQSNQEGRTAEWDPKD